MTQSKHITVGGTDVNQVVMGNDLPFTLIAGNCQMQSRDLSMKTCEYLVKLCEKLKIGFVFKNSYDKANRNALKGDRGVGLEYAMPVFDEIRKTFKCPVLTDVHTEEQAATVAPHVDVEQQPAFLVRQTDLTVAIAKNARAINIKKSQFQAPGEMGNIIGKAEASGNTNIMLTERGSCFGYGNLVVDTRSYVIMSETGYPVVCDATHSVQRPAAMGSSSGGDGWMAPYIARAALATGRIAALFIETHPEPLEGGSDRMNMIPLMYMEEILKQFKAVDEAAKANPARAESDWNQAGAPI
ncbi:MAG: 3-deoxy-8-phosphooctulonate synthase [Rickettsiales bacterium]|jgi:2-dehydro-3-deoxyphosphooctonate aldolase (KDO 8-P synthase)|nr:3-deoxy-8-phosphooctulonate synthase [Rickettsiales bacterium]